MPSSLVKLAPFDHAKGIIVCHDPVPPAGSWMPYSAPPLVCRSVVNCFSSSQVLGASVQPAFSARSLR